MLNVNSPEYKAQVEAWKKKNWNKQADGSFTAADKPSLPTTTVGVPQSMKPAAPSAVGAMNGALAGLPTGGGAWGQAGTVTAAQGNQTAVQGGLNRSTASAVDQWADLKKQTESDIAAQVKAFQDQMNALKLNTDYAIGQNNQYLAEQIAKMQQQKAVDEQKTINLQNRRGGFYSGGLDYQMDGLNRGYTEAQGGLQRDIASRNQQLLAQYGQAANSIADSIQKLKTSAPDMIRQRIAEAQAAQEKSALEKAKVTGYYNGTPTASMQNQLFDQSYKMDRADRDDYEADRNYGMKERELDMKQKDLDFEKEYRLSRANADDQKWLMEYERKGQEFAEKMKLDWATLSQREKESMADIAYKQQSLELQRSKQENQDNVDMDEERKGLAAALRDGSISPALALQQIDQDLRMGFYTVPQAEELKGIVRYLSPSAPVPQEQQTLTKEQADSMPSDKQLDMLYEQEGKPLGAPRIDWKQWYRDPKGRFAGVDFQTWHQLYGPKLQ